MPAPAEPLPSEPTAAPNTDPTNDGAVSEAETILYPETVDLLDDAEVISPSSPEDQEDDTATQFYPDPDDNQDLYVDTSPEVWSYLSQAMKYAATTASFSYLANPLSRLDFAISQQLYADPHFSFEASAEARAKGIKKKKDL